MTRRIVQLLIGLFLYGIAIAMMVRAGIGVSPWDVLTQGISHHTPLGFGTIVILTGIVLLLIWIPLKQKPGIGTVLNVLLVGPAADLGLHILPSPDQIWAQILLFGGGLALLAIATGLYIGASFGPGPRDGLMTGIHARFGWPIWAVRTGIEGTVLIVGWLLGGTVGFGTLAFALLIGPMVGKTIPLFAIPRVTPDIKNSDAAAAAPEGGETIVVESTEQTAPQQPSVELTTEKEVTP